MMTVRQLAHLFGTSEAMVRYHIRMQRIPHQKTGKYHTIYANPDHFYNLNIRPVKLYDNTHILSW